jgi:hypothetical protein
MELTKKTARELKQGEFVQFKAGGPVWVRGSYDRTCKTYRFYSADDVNRERFTSGDKTLFIGFTY